MEQSVQLQPKWLGFADDLGSCKMTIWNRRYGTNTGPIIREDRLQLREMYCGWSSSSKRLIIYIVAHKLWWGATITNNGMEQFGKRITPTRRRPLFSVKLFSVYCWNVLKSIYVLTFVLRCPPFQNKSIASSVEYIWHHPNTYRVVLSVLFQSFLAITFLFRMKTQTLNYKHHYTENGIPNVFPFSNYNLEHLKCSQQF